MGFFSKSKASDTTTGGKMSQAYSSSAHQSDMDESVGHNHTETESTSPGEQPSHNEAVSDP